MAWHTILQKPGPWGSAGLEELSNIIRALLSKHGFALTQGVVKHVLEGDLLTVLDKLALQLATKGLESGEELKPAGTNGALPCMLHTGMLPKQKQLVMAHSLL